ncbi:MAG TPA: glutamate synthase-related protein [Candidatus Limnocylindria bacterium]|nr:glutamate synthase-related protein [Candidatus Limnocylindria bacterium]
MDPSVLRGDERDACALVAVARKDARPGPGPLALVLNGLERMAHRSGEIDGEGDGAGVLVDIPRALWAAHLADAGLAAGLAVDPRFAVGHLFVPRDGPADTDATIREVLARHRVRIALERTASTSPAALLPRGRAEEPRFVQLALQAPARGRRGDRALHLAAVEIEALTPATVVSLSRSTAAYKLRGAARQLVPYYSDLGDPRFRTSAAFGHNRYSTNTSSTFARVQPFASFAHNGEIDTIGRLREETRSLGVPIVRQGSDSQDVDALLRGLVHALGLDPIEAIELVFPPIVNEVRRLPNALQDAYAHARAAFGPFAQGPAAFLARFDDLCLFGVDAMGLRPLWHVETDEEHIFASERGFVPLERYVADPRPLGPGEHAALERARGGWQLLDHDALRERFVRARSRHAISFAGSRARLETGGPLDGPPARGRRPDRRVEVATPPDEIDDHAVAREQRFAALGYEPEDLRTAAYMSETAGEPIGSLGYDGPLGALSTRRTNLADHLHESVAVVTNPAIDREREIEHFSTRVVLGPRPAPNRAGSPRAWVELRVPILLGGHDPRAGLADAEARALASRLGTWVLDDLVGHFTRQSKRPATVLQSDRDWEEGLRDALARIGAAACAGVRAGSRIVVIEDRTVFEEGRSWIDPLLAAATVHRALLGQPSRSGSLRRDCAVVLSAASVRNLHDLVVALGLGADAVAPYLLLEHAIATGDPDAPANLVEALRKGIEKVISTLGIHELRGYGRAFSAIGLAPDVARLLGVHTFAATDGGGIGWAELERDGEDRARLLRERTPARLEHPFRLYPRVWKAALAVANGEAAYDAYAQKLEELEREHPIALRHVLDVRATATDAVADTRTGPHEAPFYISSMSFGSQGETAYRAYAEAAYRLGILCINGEGGELPDLIGRYPAHRGQQIASGRFGVSALLANSSDYLEIKIGQGAKPGEGGHLPGRKVSAKVALARNAQVGVDLISPSNNHDIYSIEDLAQVVHELKTVNPRAKVSVKIPVTPDVGIIACGVAKSGADIVTLSGYDGGTGAARLHALRRAGLPAEIGVAEAHAALTENGLRSQVELWCDGGMKSALDVVKMMCLGADRVGFATLAMVALGCTICRGCQLDTCHVGITTQIADAAEAAARGVKRFEPQEFERGVANLRRFFGALRLELARLTAALGCASVRELVGRTDLLVQARAHDRVDLAPLLVPVARPGGAEGVPAAVAVLAGESAIGDRALGPADRSVATAGSGALARQRIAVSLPLASRVIASYGRGSVAGNGLGAYMADGVTVEVAGGAQDGAAKTALGGTLSILKGPNAVGRFVDGSVGKAFAYGAQRGRLFVQGGADARAAIRLSGAEVVFGGDLGGFAFEYMTGGTAVVLGDPGRWICSGMSGGLVFLRLDPSRGLDEDGLRARFAKGAKVSLRVPDPAEAARCADLLGAYAGIVASSGQGAEAARVRALCASVAGSFRVVRPGQEQVDQTVTTE